MAPPYGLITLTAVLSVTLIYLLSILPLGRRPRGFPPGPPTLPIIGNLHLMPSKPGETGQKFEEWARKYGPIYSVILGTQVWIVLNKDWVVRDLLDKRGAIYSSRPDAYLAQTVFSGGMRSFLIKDGKTFKRNRRLGRLHLNEKVSRVYALYQDLENKAMLVDFLERPELFIDHFKRFTTSVTARIVYGSRVLAHNNSIHKALFLSFDRFSEICFSSAATLLDMYPLLRLLPDPLLPAKKLARGYHQAERENFMQLYQDLKKKTREDTAPPCFCREMVRVQEEEGLSDVEAAYTCGSLLQGGLGSTVETLTGFVKAMVLFPNVVKTAQTELDRVCGDRIPDLSDWTNLSYVRGCVKEVLRWLPAGPLGIPHALTTDDEYMGYKLPKGATVICNVRAIHHDPDRYPNPWDFDPTRWIHDDETAAQSATNADVTKRDHFAFGAGRRLCQGIFIAERSLFLAISRLLWGFNFKRVVDIDSGAEIPIPGPEDLQGGMFVMPRPFRATVVPRDEEKERLVRQAWNEASKLYLDERTMQWKDDTGPSKTITGNGGNDGKEV
ncbi:cytochrome P450 [Poronia punctata]|nr:cytochrome P450 [Poronia punctata]